MWKTFLVAMGIGIVGCSQEQPAPQYGSSHTTSGPVSTQPSSPSGGDVPSTAVPLTADEQTPEAMHELEYTVWHVSLLRAALDLPSLTSQQREQIHALVDEQKTVNANARAVHAQLLNALADEVASGTVTANSLAPTVQTVVTAIATDQPADRRLLESLHALLSPEQRTEVANDVESRTRAGGQGEHRLAWLEKDLNLTQDQESQIETRMNSLNPTIDRDARAAARADHLRLLEAFKSNTFVMSQVAPPKSREAIQPWVEHIVVVAEAAAPVLTSDQRAKAASILRQWAAKSQM